MAYVIGEDCISCGTCAGECPVEAISEGAERYVIDADACTAFPKHLGHTRKQIPSRYIRLGIFRFNVCKMQKKADLCMNNKKNPYICNLKGLFYSKTTINYEEI